MCERPRGRPSLYPPLMPRTSVAAATAELAARDPVIAGLVAQIGPATLRRRGRERRDHFGALARSIAYQQLPLG